VDILRHLHTSEDAAPSEMAWLVGKIPDTLAKMVVPVKRCLSLQPLSVD
jgi:hypothetical protein